MKIIDLFYNIMTDEKVPQKIKYHNKIWELDTNKINGYFDYINCDNRGITVFFTNYLYSNSNDEVEIIEEEPRDIEVCGSLFTKSEYDKLAHSEEEKKIPEKLIPTSLKGIDNLDEKIEIAHIDTISVIETVNQVIDYLKSKGE